MSHRTPSPRVFKLVPRASSAPIGVPEQPTVQRSAVHASLLRRLDKLNTEQLLIVEIVVVGMIRGGR